VAKEYLSFNTVEISCTDKRELAMAEDISLFSSLYVVSNFNCSELVLKSHTLIFPVLVPYINICGL